MLVLISPAKTLDYTSSLAINNFTIPALLPHSKILVEICRQLTPAQLASLMGISDKLAGLNTARFAEWSEHFSFDNARQAILAFKGDVYEGLQADSFTEQNFLFAQEHLCILSGLYGLLSPLDLMQPYRLEMGTKLTNPRGNNLYQFWGSLITDEINHKLQQGQSNWLINLASDEYFKAVKHHELQANMIKPIFLDEKNGQYKVISFYAKKARGLMARFIIENRLISPEQLREFDWHGYQYSTSDSTPQQWVFKRAESAL